MIAPKIYEIGIYKPIQHSPLRNESIGIALLHSSEGNEEVMLKKKIRLCMELKWQAIIAGDNKLHPISAKSSGYS
ncbi:MAG: hypothetical protein ACI8PW_000511 [Methylophilaceae bacterium]|jgi:hypothetical protein